MRDITFYDLNLFALILMIALYIIVSWKQDNDNLRTRLFKGIITSTFFILILEMLSWIFDGYTTDFDFFMNKLINTIVVMTSTIVVSHWALYIDYVVFADDAKTKRQIKYYFIPTYVLIILGVINLFHPILFTFDSNNVYERLPLIWLSMVMTFVIYFVVLQHVIVNYRKMATNFIVGVMVFLVMPLVAALVQMTFLGLTLMWPFTAMAIVFTYLLFETTSGDLDYLTGIHTRIRAEEQIKRLKNKNKPFSVIMIDMDDFKQLNDTYGHQNGDKALVEMAHILRDVFGYKDVVARFGGDEFIIVTDEDIQQEFETYRNNVAQLMTKSKNDYIKQAKFSMGVASCCGNDDNSMEELLVAADNAMYQDKAQNKNYKRRRTD